MLKVEERVRAGREASAQWKVGEIGYKRRRFIEQVLKRERRSRSAFFMFQRLLTKIASSTVCSYKCKTENIDFFSTAMKKII